MKKYLIILLLPLLVFTIGCEDDLESENILGTWETSSVCLYQNIETCNESILSDSTITCDDITESWILQNGNWNMTFTDSSVFSEGRLIYTGYLSVDGEIIETFGWSGSNPYTLLDGDIYEDLIKLNGDTFTWLPPDRCALFTMRRKN